MAMLESEHTMESARDAGTDWKHDFALREAKGRLVDELRLLQQREDKKRSHSGQDSVQEEFGSADKTVFEVVAREAAQLLEGRSVHISWVRSGSVHNIGALVVGEEVQSHSFPAD